MQEFYVSYENFDINNVVFLPFVESKARTAAVDFATSKIEYKYQTKTGVVQKRLCVEGPTLLSTAGLKVAPNKKNQSKIDNKVTSKLSRTNEEQKRYIEINEQLMEAATNHIIQNYEVFAVKTKYADINSKKLTPEEIRAKVAGKLNLRGLVFPPQSEDDAEIDPDEMIVSHSCFDYEFVDKKNGEKRRARTKFFQTKINKETGKGEPVDFPDGENGWSLVQNCSLTYIPRVSYNDIYFGSTSQSLRIQLDSAIVTHLEPLGSRVSQREAAEKVAASNPEQVDALERQINELLAKRKALLNESNTGKGKEKSNTNANTKKSKDSPKHDASDDDGSDDEGSGTTAGPSTTTKGSLDELMASSPKKEEKSSKRRPKISTLN